MVKSPTERGPKMGKRAVFTPCQVHPDPETSLFLAGGTTKFLGQQTLTNPEGQGGLETWRLSDPQIQPGQPITHCKEKSGDGGARDGKQSAPLVNRKWEKSLNSVR